MARLRLRISTIMIFIAIAAVPLALLRLVPQQTFLGYVLLAFLMTPPAIILVTFTLMVLLAFRRK